MSYSNTLETFDGKGSVVATEKLPDERLRAMFRSELQQSDTDMARIAEDIFDVLPDDLKAKLPQRAKDRIAERKAIRQKMRDLG